MMNEQQPFVQLKPLKHPEDDIEKVMSQVIIDDSGQRFVVCCFCTTKDDKQLLKILRAFSEEDDAVEYAKDVMAKHEIIGDIGVFRMDKWLPMPFKLEYFKDADLGNEATTTFMKSFFKGQALDTKKFIDRIEKKHKIEDVPHDAEVLKKNKEIIDQCST